MYSKPIRIRETLAYAVDSYGNGAAYVLIRKRDYAFAFFQGDDADVFRGKLRAHDLARPGSHIGNFDNIACDYDEVLQPLDCFTQGYIDCMLWADGNADALAGSEGDCDGADATFADLAPCAIAACIADCAAFQAQRPRDLQRYVELGRDLSHAGHDFYLSRVGHGTGFWDRGFGAVGDSLDNHAKSFRHFDIYRGDDGLIYIA